MNITECELTKEISNEALKVRLKTLGKIVDALLIMTNNNGNPDEHERKID